MTRSLRKELARLAGYVASGLAATGSHYVVMVALVQWAGWWEVAASSAGFLVGALVKYPLNYWVVFRSRAAHGRTLLRFAIGLAAGFALTASRRSPGHPRHYLVSQVLTTGVVTVVNYLMARNWIFRAGRKASDEIA
jgi:putative flippase GtrA